METFHNPDRFIADLRQVLSQGRKRIGVLVGAGAPISVRVNEAGQLDGAGKPLIPGVEDLTKRVLAELSKEFVDPINAIVGGLGQTANIELILSRVRLLTQALGATKVNGLDASGYLNASDEICAGIGKLVSAQLPKEPNAYTEFV